MRGTWRVRSTVRPLAVTLAVALVAGCSSSGGGPAAPLTAGPPPGPTLTLVASHAMDVSEPSDLAIDATGTILWAVTNNPDSVYQLDLTGKKTKSLGFGGQDLEGIAYDASDGTLWVAEENRREVIHLGADGAVLSRQSLSLTGQPNSGLEGICLDDAGTFFLLNEKEPGMFLELGAGMSIAARETLTFAGDYSGLAYDPPSASFWIVSDQSKRLYQWKRAGGIQKSFDLPFPKAEGVALDLAAHLVYIVSDSENRLYVYRYTP